MRKFFFHDETQPVQFAEGAERRVLAYSDSLMGVEVSFKKGAEGAMHAHPHEQISYIISGAFSFKNGGETKEVRAGDSILFAPDVEHGVTCVEDGIILDIFAPHRRDFL